LYVPILREVEVLGGTEELQNHLLTTETRNDNLIESVTAAL
jgi:hypothetical protein